MRKITFAFLQYISVFIFALCLPQSVFAHGGEPRLEISAERLKPGSVLEIRGVDFEFEEEISLALIGSQVEIPVGTMLGDAEGVFLLTITLPNDLAEGTYTVRATTDDHTVVSPQITVWGTAMLGDEEEGQRAEEDSLLAPIPTFAPGVAPVGVSQAAVQPEPQVVPTSNRNFTVFVSSVLLLMTMLAIWGLRLTRKR
ncbi:MAG TPA: hypothetical protein VLE49_15285 [Anaerolineales bacterium]|nr:hypothetical protein [Anaerolineales bacterium]